MPKSDIPWAVSCIKDMAETYETCQDYYDGNQPLLFATEKFRNAFGTLFREFADNLCPTVVEAVSDRLKVTGWDGKDAKKAQVLWDKWRLVRIADQIHRTSPMKGDAYVFVWPNKDNDVTFWPHEPDQVCIEYDDEDDPSVIIKAAKLWQEDDETYRCTLYYEDAIEKYETTSPIKGGGAPEKEYRWQLIGVTDNNTGRIPIFHFGNRAEIGELGVSRLKDVIPLQNALNKSVMDMLVAMEFVAMPQRYATGLQIEVDEETGKPKNPPFTPGVDRIWTAAGDVKFGQFSPADLKQFLEVQDGIRMEMARVSGTPPHFLSLEKTMPSGEALKVSEGRLIKAIEGTTDSFGPTWVDLMSYASQLDGDAGKFDPEQLKPVWGNASPHNPLLDSETQLVLQQVGLSQRQSLRELGYSDEKIDEMQQELIEEALNKAEVAAAAMPPQPQLLGPDGKPMQTQDPSGRPTAFNRNGAPGTASKPAPQQQKQKLFGGVPVPLPRAGRGQWSDS